jgi:hypothetical protein
MRKAVWSAVTAAAFLICASPASAQLAQANVNATVTVGNLARLTITGGPIDFPDSDPDTVPTIVSAPVDVSARARVAPATSLSVTVVASATHFDTSTNTIPVSNMTWTVSGAPFVAGTMSTTAQPLGNWTGPGNQTTTQTYSLVNSWAYAPGTYSVTLTYTLATP